MNPQEVMNQATDALHVRRVFGEPVQKNGLTIIPVAALRGGWGGGFGQGQQQTESGWGGGGAVTARPVGVFVIKGEDVTWHPTVDVSRTILMGQVLGAIFLLTVWSAVRAWGRGRQN